MHKWGLVPPSANCRCGAEEQTAAHILASCPQYHPPNGTVGLAALDNDTVDWLTDDKIGPNEEKNVGVPFMNSYNLNDLLGFPWMVQMSEPMSFCHCPLKYRYYRIHIILTKFVF